MCSDVGISFAVAGRRAVSEEKPDVRSAAARSPAAKADGEIAEAQAGDSPRLHSQSIVQRRGLWFREPAAD